MKNFLAFPNATDEEMKSIIEQLKQLKPRHFVRDYPITITNSTQENLWYCETTDDDRQWKQCAHHALKRLNLK